MTHKVTWSLLCRRSITFLLCNRGGEAIFAGQGRSGLLVVTVLLTSTIGCAPDGAAGGRRVVPSYDDYSRKLIGLSADQNGDGRIEQWTYLDGNRPLRGEADADGDGRIDRWEYFNADGVLTAIGTSSANDGNEDTWTDVAKTTAGETHVARSSDRDHVIDRHEYFQGDALTRIEEDTNHDGRIDKWSRFEAGVLRQVDFDTSFNTGRATRRVLYDASGRFVAVEVDPDGDGVFERTAEKVDPQR